MTNSNSSCPTSIITSINRTYQPRKTLIMSKSKLFRINFYSIERESGLPAEKIYDAYRESEILKALDFETDLDRELLELETEIGLIDK